MILHLSRRAAVAGLHFSAAKCFQCTVRVLSIRLGKSLFVFYCHESPNVLAKYLQSAWGVTPVFAARCLLMYCQSTFNLSGGVTSAFRFGRALISSIKIPRRVLLFFGLSSVILLLCRRAAVAGLHCLLPSASNVLPSTFNLSGEVTSVSTAKCLLMYCQVPSICLGESLLWLCFSRALISSAKSFVGACCFWTELCVVPASV